MAEPTFKKITVQALVPGMFVSELPVSWLDHPFLRSQFLVEDHGTVERIRALGVREVVIDTSRGCDVGGGPAPVSTPVSAPAPPAPAVQPGAPDAPPRTVSLAEERASAERVQREAGRVVTKLLEDVRLGRQIEVQRVSPVVDGIVSSVFRNPDALLGLGRIRNADAYTFEHSVSVAVLMVAFARSLGLERQVIQEVGVGAMLHDLGKIRVPDAILNKPGRLTPEEFAVMKSHAAISRDVLRETPGVPRIAVQVAGEHHERVDGSGYPDGLAGAAISRFGRMAAVVDVYDAITADRVYRKGEPPTAVLRRMLEWSGSHLDAELVQRFIQCVGIYPIGTLVRLASGRLGVVIASGEGGPLEPVLKLVYHAGRRQFITPRVLDLSRADTDDRIVAAEDPARWPVRVEVFLSP